MNKEQLAPEQINAITDLILKVDTYKHAMVFGQAVVEVSRQLKIHPLQLMEHLLRQMESDTYLIACSISETEDYVALLPHSEKQEYPFYLWIGVNGRREATEKLRRMGKTPAQNFIDLKNTGMLVPKPESTTPPI